jgi:hypothetical protein
MKIEMARKISLKSLPRRPAFVRRQTPAARLPDGQAEHKAPKTKPPLLEAARFAGIFWWRDSFPLKPSV